MPLINLVFVLIVVGVLLWLVNSFIPMDRKIKQILNIVVVIGVVIWLLQVFGLIVRWATFVLAADASPGWLPLQSHEVMPSR